MTEAPENSPSKNSTLTGFFFLIFIAFVIYEVATTYFSSLTSHGGAARLLSIGEVRVSKCEYKGNFVGGIGYDCIMRNFSTHDRGVSKMQCVSYDSEDRLIGTPSLLFGPYGSTFSPSQERIMRIYGSEDARTVVCSETGDFPSAPIQKIYDSFFSANLANEVKL